MKSDQYSLITQLPKPENLGVGTLSVGKEGDAHFFGEKSDCLADMKRTRLEWAAAKGLFISGMEPDGFDRSGREKFKYQEWFLAFDELIISKAEEK